MAGRFNWFALVALMSLGGCSGSSSSSKPRDAGCDGPVLRCPWTPCTKSVKEACASGSTRCLMTWPADVTAFCSSSYPGANRYSATRNCGAYYAFWAEDIEGHTGFYYSAKTGQLVGIIGEDGQFRSKWCVGGPSGFVEPKCSSGNSFTCPDAGTDAGGGVAGGAGAGP